MLKSKGKTLLFLKSKNFKIPDLFIVNSNFFLKIKMLLLKKYIKNLKMKKLLYDHLLLMKTHLKQQMLENFKVF